MLIDFFHQIVANIVFEDISRSILSLRKAFEQMLSRTFGDDNNGVRFADGIAIFQSVKQPAFTL